MVGKKRAAPGSAGGKGGKAEYAWSLVLPVRDREREIGSVLAHLAAWVRQLGWRSEVVVVDDGSGDRTDGAAASWRTAFHGLQVVRHEAVKGVGAAARTGVLVARGEFVVVADPDADLPALAQGARILVEQLALGADFAVLSPALDGADPLDERPFLERAAETAFLAVSRLVMPVGVRDGLGGMKGVRRRAARKIAERSRVDGPAFGTEWLALAHWFGFRVVECSPPWTHPRARTAVLRSTDAAAALCDLWKTRWRLRREAYLGSRPMAELLHETSFIELDRR